MKLTYSMLREYVDTSFNAEQVADKLTMTGFELEDITEVEGDQVLDINIMANRGDGASIIGLAREFLAKVPNATPTELFLRAEKRFPAPDAGNRDIWSKTSAEIQTQSCTRFSCRIFENVQNGPSPEWLQQRLRQIGQRPISLLVDLTNYVMMETGQPLHSFDLDKLVGERIMVRNAVDGEKLTTLDGTEHELHPHHMVIADAERAVALAGVMGGEETEVSASTTRCLLESAHFINTSVRRTRKELGLFTEASYRFERHVDPEGTTAALNRFAELYLEITNNSPVGGIIDVIAAKPPLIQLTVFIKRASRLLGMEISFEQAESYLLRLGFIIVGKSPDSLEVIAPTWRSDILREEDLIEELGRVHGYELIPEELPIGSTPIGGPQGFELLTDNIREAALRCGLDQCISHSLRDIHPLDADGSRTQVRTPHSPEMAYLRNSILPSLCDAVRKNNADNIHIFEIGRVHNDESESTQLGIISSGSFENPTWRDSDPTTADFFTLKGTIEQIAHAIQLPVSYKRSTTDPRFHPTRQARIILGGSEVGIFGQIHPLVAEKTDLSPGAVMAEITLDPLKNEQTGVPTSRAISRNPAARRDIAILIKKEVPYSEIDQAIVKSGGETLENHWLFDVYEGKGVPDGQHSLAIALQFRKLGENFTDEEANDLRDKIVSALESIGASLR